MNSEIKTALLKLCATLRDVGEEVTAKVIEGHLVSSDAKLEEFLRSNELWGGSGSISDQAGIGFREKSRKVEAALIELGSAQVRAGITNVRTAGWTEVFMRWRIDGV